jgi:hypothetical protein
MTTDQGSGDPGRYVQAWFLFCDADGRVSSLPGERRHVTVAVTRDCRVVVTRPGDVTALAPELDATVTARIAEADAYAARRRDDLGAQGLDGKGRA